MSVPISLHSDTTLARRLCRACPVATDCLEYALRHDERYGIWGGLDPVERAALRRKSGVL